jgi:hypothetical protein
MWLKIKEVCINYKRSRKKFKDDIAYQKDMATQAMDGQDDKLVNLGLLIVRSPISLVQHIVIWWLCYSGFIRMAYSDSYYKFLIVFSHVFELMGHTIPFMMI